MNIPENNERQPQDFLYRVVTAAVFIVLFVMVVLFIMTSNGAFDRDTENPPVSSDNISAVMSPAEDEEVQGEILTDPVETAAPPVTIAPDLVAEYDPGEVDSANVFNSDLMSLYPDTVLGVTEDGGAEYLSRIIFLGDSTTYGLRPYAMLTGGKNTTQVWTPQSGTLAMWSVSSATIVYPDTGEELTISEAVSVHRPDIMVITLGVNGIAQIKEDYFKSEYKKLVENIQTLSPDTKIILQSIFPVAASYKHLDQINNEKIMTANGWIVQVAKECGVKYLDTYSALVGPDGFLPEDCQNGGDGMHFNEKGYKIELDYIRTHTID